MLHQLVSLILIVLLSLGDGHCPRQNGVYKSDEPGECDVFWTCRLGLGIPTKCSEGLHYSEQVRP